MLKSLSPLNGNHIHRPKSGRKPLQPRNFPANLPINNQINPKLKPEFIEISLIDDSNKENPHLVNPTPAKVESFDASLAEELSAIRERLERQRLDREKTEKMLRERDLVMEMNLKEMFKRGEVQKQLEMEVDRLFRLKELQSSMKISPIRSLREKQEDWKSREEQSQDLNAAEDRNTYESPMPSPSPEIHTHK
ncbi:high mobility group B protein 13-like [Actinidia eriantha]|uniref:high mobility group B protein 13-like n=1 Tax=Actinidia eriantha TaxID=165200 RepID=UPI00258D5167|nr:high mobility group B protein 13-like [Actinidia eriantha]